MRAGATTAVCLGTMVLSGAVTAALVPLVWRPADAESVLASTEWDGARERMIEMGRTFQVPGPRDMAELRARPRPVKSVRDFLSRPGHEHVFISWALGEPVGVYGADDPMILGLQYGLSAAAMRGELFSVVDGALTMRFAFPQVQWTTYRYRYAISTLDGEEGSTVVWGTLGQEDDRRMFEPLPPEEWRTCRLESLPAGTAVSFTLYRTRFKGEAPVWWANPNQEDLRVRDSVERLFMLMLPLRPCGPLGESAPATRPEFAPVGGAY